MMKAHDAVTPTDGSPHSSGNTLLKVTPPPAVERGLDRLRHFTWVGAAVIFQTMPTLCPFPGP